jgi:hypothetical protein
MFSSTRISRRPRASVLCAVGALLIVGAAGAANSNALTDPAGDAGTALDITSINASSDDAGTLTFAVNVAPGHTLGLPGDEIAVALDLDQNPDTGSPYYGTEVAAVFEGSKLGFYRASNDGSFEAAPAPSSFQGTLENGVATFSVKAADLGLAANAGFNLVGVSDSSATCYADIAPDIRTFNYQQVNGTAPSTPGPDSRAPIDSAYPSHGVHGGIAHLDYTAADGRGSTADTISVYRRSRVLKTFHFSLADTNPFFVYYAKWRVPQRVHGRLRFCVRSVDAAGNTSNQSCAPLVIR